MASSEVCRAHRLFVSRATPPQRAVPLDSASPAAAALLPELGSVLSGPPAALSAESVQPSKPLVVTLATCTVPAPVDSPLRGANHSTVLSAIKPGAPAVTQTLP